jgi:hypothetical protein
MANRTFDNVQALNKEVKVISGQVECTTAESAPGAGDAVWTTNQGIGFTPNSDGTSGHLELTLQDTYVGCLSITCNSLQTDIDHHQSVRSEDVASSKIIILQNVDTAGNLAAFALNDIVYFTLVLRNSTVQ